MKAKDRQYFTFRFTNKFTSADLIDNNIMEAKQKWIIDGAYSTRYPEIPAYGTLRESVCSRFASTTYPSLTTFKALFRISTSNVRSVLIDEAA